MIDSGRPRRLIRDEVKRQLNIILSGAAGANGLGPRTRLSSAYTQVLHRSPARPVMHPYGIASRAPAGTIQVTGPGRGLDRRTGWSSAIATRSPRRPRARTRARRSSMPADGTTVLSKILVSNDQGIVAEVSPEGALVIKKGEVEFVAQIAQLFTDIQAGLVSTILGPQPLVMPTFATDLAKLQTFVGT